ncbi:MAG: hypothetical protein AAGK14_04400 [Verrucomicrobiota bacterium]
MSSTALEAVKISGRMQAALAAGIFVLALLLAAYTQNAWEDWYITYRASQNLAAGEGLVFQPGERVHSFTSPLGVLIPAGIAAAVGPATDVGVVLWIFRVVCALVLAGTLVVLARLGVRLELAFWPMLLLLGAFCLDLKTVLFSVNGMETAYMLAGVALTLLAFRDLSRRRFWQLGVAWALLMWVRPDGCVYIGALSLGLLLFGWRNAHIQSRAELLRCLVLAGLVTTVLYLPWFLWAWWFYGSPVPHTILAKGSMHDAAPWANRLIDMLRFPVISLYVPVSLDAMYLPPEAVAFGGWHPAVLWVSKLLSWIAAFYWLMPRSDAWSRGVSFGLFLLNLYFCFVMNTLYPWYIPPGTMLTTLVLALILQRALAFFASRENRPGPLMLRGAVVAFLVYLGGLFAAGAYHTHWRQFLIEDGLRRELGVWLNENSPTGQETVFIECLGYVGYFSQLKMLDWPGLSSPEVVAARKKHQTEKWETLIRELQPDWVVLRDHEADFISSRDPGLLQGPYREVKRFDREPDVEALPWMPGRMYFILDDTFVVYQRAGEVAPPVPPPSSADGSAGG